MSGMKKLCVVVMCCTLASRESLTSEQKRHSSPPSASPSHDSTDSLSESISTTFKISQISQKKKKKKKNKNAYQHCVASLEFPCTWYYFCVHKGSSMKSIWYIHQKFFLGVQTYVKPNLVSKNFPFTGEKSFLMWENFSLEFFFGPNIC